MRSISGFGRNSLREANTDTKAVATKNQKMRFQNATPSAMLSHTELGPYTPVQG